MAFSYTISAEISGQQNGVNQRPNKITSRLFDLGNDGSVLQKRTFSNTENLHDSTLCLKIRQEDPETGSAYNYACEAPFSTDFMPKMQSWLNKRKFVVKPGNDDSLQVRVGGLFDFAAKRVECSDMQLVQEEVRAL